ncbi:MAG: PEGA domain-containing protein [bacterium]|nr:PEGA domain-containing protein [bacterium]
MRLWIRRIIFSIFALSFAISAIGLLLYANGYRFNIDSGWFEKTGVIYASSDPSGASISLGTATTGSFWQRSVLPRKPFKTPQRITYVLPGVYHVILSKDSYFDFRRDIEVQVGKTAFFNDIVLLKQSSPSRITDVSAVDTMIPLNKSSFVVSTSQGLSLLNIKTDTLTTLDLTQKKIANIKISPDGAFIFVQNDVAWYRYDVNNPLAPSVRIDIALADHLAFDNHGILYSCGGKGIIVHPDISQKIVVHDREVFDCVVSGSNLYFLSRDTNGVSVDMIATGQSNSPAQSRAHLPVKQAIFGDVSASDLLIKGSDGSSFIYDTHDAVPHIVDLEKMTHVTVYDENTYVGNNDIEMNRYYISKNAVSKNLITRESDGISDVTIEPTIPYIFFVSRGHDIIALENSDNPSSNRYIIATFDHVEALRMLSDKKTLLIAGTQDGNNGIFTLQVLP